MQFRVLGPFEAVADDGRVVDVGGPKQRAVLAMLCLDAGRISPLDRMIAELWEDPPPTAAATIQTYISNLRRVLEPDRQPRRPSTVLVSRAPGYVLDVPVQSIDAERFRIAVEAAHTLLEVDPAAARQALDDALALWRGPALADFAYEPFAQADIHRLEELRLAAVEDRVEAGLRLGDHAAVVGELEALVRDNPLRERMWGQLMIGLYRSGRQSEALRAFQRCSDMLVEGLGLTPSPALRQLEQQILAQDPTLDLAVPAEPTSPTPSSAPAPAAPRPPTAPASAESEAGDDDDGSTALVGRADEMSVVRDAITRAIDGRGTLLFVDGEPGAGKSRLLEESVRVARHQGLATAVSRCFEVGETPPFWPFVQATRALGSQLGTDRLSEAAGGFLTELTPLFPELGADTPAKAPLSPHHVAGAMVYALRNLTATTPVLIGIDDVHAADPDSVTMLVALADAIADMGAVAVATCREGAILEDDHLGDVVAALVRLPQARRVTLTPLGVDEVGRVVTDVTGREVDPTIAAAVHDRTDGNAFYTVELARLLAAEDLPAPGSERWTDVVPATVRDVIRRRLARMPDALLDVLRVAAVAGRSFDAEVLARVTRIDIDVLLDDLDLAVACGTLTGLDRPGRFRFTHVLVRDTIAGAVNSLRQARLHGQLADALEELHDHAHDPETLSEMAYHAVEARRAIGVERALAALRAAAAAAAAAGAFAGAEAMHRRRVALSAELPDGPARVEHEQQALGDLAAVVVARRGYQTDDLVPIHRRLSELAERSTPEVAVQTAIGRWVFHTTRGELDGAEAVHGQLTAMLAGAPDLMAALIVEHSGGILSLHRGDVPRALERFGRCEGPLATIDPGDSGTVLYPGLDQSVVVSHTNFLAVAQWLAGDTAASNSTLDRGAAAARRGGRPYSVAFALTFRAYVAAMRHDVDRARVDGRHAAEVCAEHGLAFLASMVDVVTSWAAAATGDADAIPTLEAIDELLVKGQTGGFSTVSWGLVADAHRRLGRTGAAREVLGRALDFSDRGGEMIWRPELERLWWALDDDHDDLEPLSRAASLADRLGLVALRQRCEGTLDRPA